MFSCAVKGCKSNSSDDPYIEFFPFPLNKKRLLRKWIKVCGLREQDINIKEAHVCASHFEDEAFITSVEVQNKLSFITKHLNELATPTLNLPTTSDNSRDDIPLDIQDTLSIEVGNVIEKNNQWKKKIKDLEQEIERLKTLRLKQKRAINQMRNEDVLQMKSEVKTKWISKVLTERQIRYLSGNRRVFWTIQDMIIAYTIRHLSNLRFYEYLSAKMYPLPSLSTMKRWIQEKSKTHQPNQRVKRKTKRSVTVSANNDEDNNEQNDDSGDAVELIVIEDC